MKYLIAIIASVLALIFSAGIVYCGYKAFTDDLMWGFVMLGLVLPTALTLLIAQTGFISAQEY